MKKKSKISKKNIYTVHEYVKSRIEGYELDKKAKILWSKLQHLNLDDQNAFLDAVLQHLSNKLEIPFHKLPSYISKLEPDEADRLITETAVEVGEAYGLLR